DAVLDTAEALETSIVRVWAGERASAEADQKYRHAVLQDAFRVVEQAAKRSITISLEFHAGTLTDNLDSTLSLLNTVNSSYFQSFWQPPHTPDLDAKIQGLQVLLPWLTNVHVFHWHPQTLERFRLAEGESDWHNYMPIITNSERKHTLSLEFVRGDDPDIFMEDAHILRSWVATCLDPRKKESTE
ncbi:MAG: sugar phosphate isomerase/epimerase, partial [Anaerolineae bacterium]|nr:sugar phosphate isomerase/epimerase [Anaerolineae bacterium]